MAFLRTLFWIVLTVVVVVFSIRNWVPVTISLFGNIDADVKLPVLLLIAFLIGFLPVYVWHRIWRWRIGRHPVAPAGPTVVPPAPAPPSSPMAGSTLVIEPHAPGIDPARAD